MIGCRCWLWTGATRLTAATTITDDEDVVDNGGDDEEGGDGGAGGEGDLVELTFLPGLAAGERFHLPPANPASPVGGELTGDVGSKIPSKLSSSFPTTTGGEVPTLVRGGAPTPPREGFSCSPELLPVSPPPPLHPSRRSKFSFDIRPESSLQSLSWYVLSLATTLPTGLTILVNDGSTVEGLTPAILTIFGGVSGRASWSSVVISGIAAVDDKIW
uniref:Putative secreted protein n=1 Tax=Anopheles marajoara TaxID=58244 RepID=A0A2M4C6Q6_9DIPT